MVRFAVGTFRAGSVFCVLGLLSSTAAAYQPDPGGPNCTSNETCLCHRPSQIDCRQTQVPPPENDNCETNCTCPQGLGTSICV
jgi:hypothetical protein